MESAQRVTFGQLLYAGDDLSGDAWDQREWNDHTTGRETLFRLAAGLPNNLAQTLTSNRAGEFVLTPANPGFYRVEVSAAGFGSVQANDVEVQVGQSARVDVELKIGDVATKIEVSAAAPLLNTESATLGQEITNKQITDLPLNGRSSYELARLTPGATLLPGGGNLLRIRANFESGTSISGVAGSQTSFYLDGVDTTDHHQGGTLIQTSIAHFAPHAWNKVSIDQVFDSYTGMVEVILFPVVALLVLAAAVYFLARMCPHCRAGLRPAWLSRLADRHANIHGFAFPEHEITAVFLLMLYPFLGYLVASLHGGMLSPRFVIPVCLGFAIAGTTAAHHVFGRLPSAGVIAVLLCSAIFLGRACAVRDTYDKQKQCFYQVLRHLPPTSNQPIAVPDPLMALTLVHYAPRSIASRIVFPVDFPAIRLFRGEDSPEENLWAARGLYDLSIVPLADFQHNAADYLILASDGNWLVRDLRNHSYPVNRLPASFPHEAIKGFTPLDHGDPAFFLGSGDRSDRTHRRPAPVPFNAQANLPEAPSLNANSQL